LRCDDAPGGGRADDGQLAVSARPYPSERACTARTHTAAAAGERATTYVQQHASLGRDGARVRARDACMRLSTRGGGWGEDTRLHTRAGGVSHASYIMRLSSKAAAASWWLHAMTWAPLVHHEVRSSYYRPRLACLGPPPEGSLGLEHWHAVSARVAYGWRARPCAWGLGAWGPTSWQ
jgi:hypothetical protein